MFGLSIGKILVLGAVILIVWVGWRKLADASQMFQRSIKRAPPEPPIDETIELVRDPVTGQYEPQKRD
ncbi:MAG: hypothetical protein ACKVH0_10090 [Alphaproteobacteria bacterium]|jgi:hypothetical protein